jgi:hypothetical protein
MSARKELEALNLLIRSPSRAMSARASSGLLPLPAPHSALDTCSPVHPHVNPRVKLREPKEVMSKIN